MSGGIGGVGGNDSVPSLFPEETIEVPGVVGGELEFGVPVDPEPEFLELASPVTSGIALPEGQFSLFEWTQILSQVIQQLREALNDAELKDSELSRNFHSTVVSESDDFFIEHQRIEATVNAWKTVIGPIAEEAKGNREALLAGTEVFNTLLTTTAANDLTAINTVNNIINIYNNQSQMQSLISSFGGNQTAALNHINSVIQNYNNYINSRPNLQAALQVLVDGTNEYNVRLDEFNVAIATINADRVAEGLPGLSGLTKTPAISNDIKDYLSYEGTLTAVPLRSAPLPSTPQTRLFSYTEPSTPARTETLRVYMRAFAANATQRAWVNSAVAAGTGSPGTNLFINIAQRYIANFVDPLDPVDAVNQFYNALVYVPIMDLVNLPIISQAYKVDQVNAVNNLINIYNDQTQMESLLLSSNNNQVSALEYINALIQNYNNFVNKTGVFDSRWDEINAGLEITNAERRAAGLPDLPLIPKTPVLPGAVGLPTVPLRSLPLPSDVDNRVSSYTEPSTPARTEIFRLAMLSLTTDPTYSAWINSAVAAGVGSTGTELFVNISENVAANFVSPQSQEEVRTQMKELLVNVPILDLVPAASLSPVLVEAPAPAEMGELPGASYSEAFNQFWAPNLVSTMFFLSSLNQAIVLSNALVADENAFYLNFGLNIVLPSALIESVRREFVEDISGIGAGIGLAGFSMGLHSRSLEIALSSALLRAISTNYRIPISGREFARLRFTAMELLARSALLSPMPAARFLVSSLGTLSVASPGIAIALAEALIIQVGGIVSSGILRSQVNAIFNRQYAKLGVLSIGGLARFTSAVSATMSLSILSVALAQLGRQIGMPGLVAQFYAHGAGVPTIDLLVAMTAGSRLLDVLDNPISILFLKQTLSDTLVFRRGFSSYSVGLLVNSAVNSILLRGGLNTFSSLRAEIINEFQLSGFSFFEANLLANETIALIRGDLGVQYLNVAFGLNFDINVIAASVVNNMLGIDIGVASAMLSNAVTRSLLYGGFGSRVRLQNELMENFQGLGLSRGDAQAIAFQTIDFIETIGILVPLNRFPGVTSLLFGEPTLRAIAFGGGLIRQELLEDLEVRGLSNTQAELVADQLLSLAARTFVRPGNLYDRSIAEAIRRSLSNEAHQTQREFRDRVMGELRAVGFSRNAASFLSNSVANYGLTGTNISIFGVSAARISALNKSMSTRLSEELGVTRRKADDIVSEARKRAIQRAPFSSPDQFQAVLREEIQREVINQVGRYDGYIIFDRAVAELASPNSILSLAGLTEQLRAHIVGILRPELGLRLAEDLRDRILVSLLGGTTIDVIENEELRNPLSVLNQINTQVGRLVDVEEEENQRKMLRRLIQLLQSLMTPNAEVGFLLQSLMDNPSTFIGSLLVDKPKGEFLDIPV